MLRRTLQLSCAFAAMVFALTASPSPMPAKHKLTIGGEFLLDGKPFQIISGELQYTRIPLEYWRDRLKMAHAMGLNTVSTYVFRNLHEPKPGIYDFTGQLDVAAFIRAAQEEVSIAKIQNAQIVTSRAFHLTRFDINFDFDWVEIGRP